MTGGWTTEGSEFESLYGQTYSLCHPDRVWGTPNLPSNEYQGFFPGDEAAGW
jgi:hypothetical protein